MLDKQADRRSNKCDATASQPSRRAVLRATGGAVATAALAGCSAVDGAVLGDSEMPSDAIQAGLLTFTQGAGAVLGIQSQRGAEQAVQRINNQGGIAGRRRVELEVRDESTDAVETYQSFIDDGFDVTFGPVSSGTHQSIAPMIEENGVINVGTDGGVTTLYEQTVPNPTYSFRAQNADVMEVVTCAREAINRLGADSIETIGGINPDYAFGRGEWELFRNTMQSLTDVEVTTVEFPALTQADMSAEVGRLVADPPDVTFGSLWGGDVITFLEAAQGTGFFDNTTLVGGIMYSAADAMTQELLSGVDAIFGSRNYYWDYPAIERWPPGEQLYTFARQQEGIGVPTAHYMSGYGAVTAWATAVEKAVDLLGEYPSQEQISRMMEGHGFFTPAGYHMISDDHEARSTTFIGDLRWSEARDAPILTNVSEYGPKNTSPPPRVSATDWIEGW